MAVVAALALRIFLFLLTHRGGDTVYPKLVTVGQEAGNIGWALASGHGFSNLFVGLEQPTAWLAPVYPALLAAGMKLFGMNPLAGLFFGQIVNCAFSACTCWPIFAVGRKLFGSRIGLASAWLWVFLPTAVLFPLEWIWDQSLSAFLLTLLLCVTLYLPEISSPLHWSGYGLLWAFTLYTNPTLGILLPVFLGWLAMRRAKNAAPWKRLVPRAALFALLPLLPWTARNYAQLDGFVVVKSNFGLELWLGNNPEVKLICTPWRHPGGSFPQKIHLIMSGEVNYMSEKQQLALHYIASHPGIFVRNCFDRFRDTWTAFYDVQTDPWVQALHASRAYVTFTTAFSLITLAGLALVLRARPVGSSLLIAAMLLVPVPYYITHSALRYRHPIDPVMCLLAVYGVAWAYGSVAASFSKDPSRA
ncbi:MAG: glycosyltransferase family 39 protein [Acidobacteriia bacterium]|nr:glycosyltransferase family 39 protein [Terriglobia bacterium]